MRDSIDLPLLPCFVALLLAPAVVLADTVFLSNGDRISGDVEEMRAHRLLVDTEYAGVIEIEWRKVERVETERPFAVWLEAGRRVTGTIAAPESGLEIVGPEGEVPAELADVVRMYPVEDSFWGRWEADVDLGIGLTVGNSGLSQGYLGIDSKYRAERYELQWDASWLQSDQTDAESVSRQTFSVQLDRFLGSRPYVFTLAKLERDINQRLALRSNFGGGFGWHLMLRGSTQFAMLGGATFSNQQVRDLDMAGRQRPPSSAEGLAGFELETDALLGIEITSKLQIQPALSGGRRLRISFDNNIRVPITHRFAWGLLVYDRYDSAPQFGVKPNDFGIVGTLGFGF